EIVLSGGNTGTVGNGLVLAGGNSIVRGLDVIGFAGNYGIVLQSNGNQVEGNFIGINADGTTAPYGLPNFSNASSNGAQFGIEVNSSSFNVIGSLGNSALTPAQATQQVLAARNLISANAAGVMFAGGSNDTVSGNYIGTDRTGTVALGNYGGIGF